MNMASTLNIKSMSRLRSQMSLYRISSLLLPDEIQVDPGFFTKTTFVQMFYGAWVNMSALNLGLGYGFSSVAMPQMQQPGSKISITLSEKALMTSVLTLSVPIGSLISGYFLDIYGRRIIMIVGQVPTAAGWLLTGLANTSKLVIIGRLVTGVGLGMLFTPPRVYVTEITLPNMRGPIGGFNNLMIGVGISLQTLMGSYLKWEMLCFIGTAFTICTMFLNILLPDTPYFTLINGDSAAILKCLKNFRAKNYENLESEMEELLEYKDNLNASTGKERLTMVCNESAMKPFCLIVPYIIVTQIVGVQTLFFYLIEILEESKSSVNPYHGSFILSLVRMFGAVFTAILLYKIGRRPMALSSCIGCGLSFIYLGCYLKWFAVFPSIQPQICYMIYVLSACFGYYTLIILLLFELLPLQVRGILGGVAVTMMNLLVFASSESFPYIRKAIGLPNTILICGCVSFLFTFYIFLFVPETKRLTLQEIEDYFRKRRPTLVSQRDLHRMSMYKMSQRKSYEASTPSISQYDLFGTREMKVKIADDKEKKDDKTKEKTVKLERNYEEYDEEETDTEEGTSNNKLSDKEISKNKDDSDNEGHGTNDENTE